MNTNMSGCAALCVLAITSGGCVNNEEPQTALTKAQSIVSRAEAKGAQEVPQASLHLKMAKDAIVRAEALMKDGQYRAAEAVLDEAQIDAELAASLAIEEDAKQQASEQVERVQSLRETNNRLASRPAYG